MTSLVPTGKFLTDRVRAQLVGRLKQQLGWVFGPTLAVRPSVSDSVLGLWFAFLNIRIPCLSLFA